jgi:hypothetical protein
MQASQPPTTKTMKYQTCLILAFAAAASAAQLFFCKSFQGGSGGWFQAGVCC